MHFLILNEFCDRQLYYVIVIFQAYFITNMEPIKFWEFVSLVLEGLGYERYSSFLLFSPSTFLHQYMNQLC